MDALITVNTVIGRFLGEALGTSGVLIFVIASLTLSIIIKLKKIQQKYNYINCHKNIHSHKVLSYINYLVKYKIRELKNDDEGIQSIMRSLFKCFLDSTSKTVNEVIIYTSDNKIEKEDLCSIESFLAEKIQQNIDDYRMLFREKASRYLNQEDIDFILEKFRTANGQYVVLLGRTIATICNSHIYYSKCEIINSVLDYTLSILIQISLNIETVFNEISGNIKSTKFNGHTIKY